MVALLFAKGEPLLPMGLLVEMVSESGKPYFRQQTSDELVLTARCDAWKRDCVTE